MLRAVLPAPPALPTPSALPACSSSPLETVMIKNDCYRHDNAIDQALLHRLDHEQRSARSPLPILTRVLRVALVCMDHA